MSNEQKKSKIWNWSPPSPPKKKNLTSSPLKFFNIFYSWSRQRFYNWKFCTKQIFHPILKYKDIGAESSRKTTPFSIPQPILMKFGNLVRLIVRWKYLKSDSKNSNPFPSYSPLKFNMGSYGSPPRGWR